MHIGSASLTIQRWKPSPCATEACLLLAIEAMVSNICTTNTNMNTITSSQRITMSFHMVPPTFRFVEAASGAHHGTPVPLSNVYPLHLFDV